MKVQQVKEAHSEFEELLDYLKNSRGFDFTAYKRASLMRRVDKRMLMAGVEGYSSYRDYLEVHPDEFTQLFNTILINVTAFFRDEAPWEYLKTHFIPGLLASKQRNEPIRLWSAGCASGEEAYTLAMLLAEQIGIKQFRERVKIYATDVDEEALSQSRQASYSDKQVESVPADLREKYFEHVNGRYVFQKELRRSVIFGRHDLIQDAPISHIDLLVCRNTLMYMNAETQNNILTRFHFALNSGAYLLLGKAETFLMHSSGFAPVDLRLRLFRKAPEDHRRERLFSIGYAGGEQTTVPNPNHARLREAAEDVSPVAQLVVDQDGQIVQANQQLRILFGLNYKDVGRPLQDLELSYRPVDLRSCIDQAHAEQRVILLKDIEWLQGTSITYLDVQFTPLTDSLAGNNKAQGLSITFTDVSRYKRLHGELQRANQELETALEELQSTNEELETTNEELQSTVEELETTNEELQSTNEEMETMNEELQSTNEELQTINEQLRQRSDEYTELNVFLRSILANLRSGVVVVNKDLLVQVWNPRVEDLWGLRSDEVQGKNLLSLDIGLPVDRLKPMLRACLAGEAEHLEINLEAMNRRGRRVQVKVSIAQLGDDKNSIKGVILLMDTEQDGNDKFNGRKPEVVRKAVKKESTQ